MSTVAIPQLKPHGEKYPIFAKRLGRAIARSGMRKFEIAAQLGLDPGMIAYWLGPRGGEPRLSTLVQLAQLLRVTPNYLLGYADDHADRFAALEAERDSLLQRLSAIEGLLQSALGHAAERKAYNGHQDTPQA